MQMRLMSAMVAVGAFCGHTPALNVGDTLIMWAKDFEQDGHWTAESWCAHGYTGKVYVVHEPPEDGQEGKMWESFPGPSGTYNVGLGSHWKCNGQAPWAVYVNDSKIAEGQTPWATTKCDCAGYGDDCLPIPGGIKNSVKINQGDKITYWGKIRWHQCGNGGVYAGWYNLTFKLISTSGTPPPPVAPAVPTLKSPSNNATGTSTSPALSWNASSGATAYELQVSTASNFSGTAISETDLDATSYTAADLSNKTKYYWRVKAKNDAGASAWSGAWNFTTVESGTTPPPPPPGDALEAESGTYSGELKTEVAGFSGSGYIELGNGDFHATVSAGKAGSTVAVTCASRGDDADVTLFKNGSAVGEKNLNSASWTALSWNVAVASGDELKIMRTGGYGDALIDKFAISGSGATPRVDTRSTVRHEFGLHAASAANRSASARFLLSFDKPGAWSLEVYDVAGKLLTGRRGVVDGAEMLWVETSPALLRGGGAVLAVLRNDGRTLSRMVTIDR
jgi:hypothetical protein